MTYFGFLGLFLAPPLIGLVLLALVDYRAKRWLPVDFRTWQPWRVLLLHIIVAVLYTTPWDNYLVATRVWWYDPSLVSGIVFGWVPLEEYTFFILQTAMTGLFTLFLLRFQGNPPRALGRKAWARANSVRWFSAGTLLLVWTISMVVLFAGHRGPTTYLVLLLSWALPPIIFQIAFGGDILWRQRRLTFLAIMIPTVYLCVGDAAAIGSGTWTISPEQSIGVLVGNLPIEEIIFFFVTNVLVVFGMLLFLARMSSDRVSAPIIGLLRPLLGKYKTPSVAKKEPPPPNKALVGPVADEAEKQTDVD